MTCLGLLRAIPGKRRVYDALWNGREVVVKVFSRGAGAKRHLEREWRGLNLLGDRGLSTPEPLFFGKTEDGDRAVVTEKIVASSTVLHAFNEAVSPTDKLDIMRLVCEELARQHSKGVLQKDMHLGNFLLQEGKVFALDPAEMCFLGRKISRKLAISQLAILASILPEENVEEITNLCKNYAAERSWEFAPTDMTLFWRKLAEHKKDGIRRSLKKCLRTNKRHVKTARCGWHAVASRDFFDKVNFDEFLENIDELMRGGQILKDGNTCFVSRVSLGGRDVVIKRYNCKGFIHSVRHTIKRSRARRNWLHAHRLGMLGIATAEPLAFIEKRKGMIVCKSYFVAEYVDGPSLSAFLKDDSLSKEERLVLGRKITEMLNKLNEHRITHGDLKHSNILIAENRPVLIDLDSMTVHRLNCLLKNRQQKDMASFENYM